MNGNEIQPDQPGLWDEPERSDTASARQRRRRTSTPATSDTPPTAPPEVAQLWTVDDVSAFLGVPKSTVYGWRTAGRGPKGFRVGKHLRWHPRTVFEWSLRLEDEQ